MTEKYLIIINVYLTLMLIKLYFKSKRLNRELDKANLNDSKMNKQFTNRIRQEPLFGKEYEVVRVGYQDQMNPLDEIYTHLPADVVQMKQKERALNEIVEELDRTGAIEVYTEQNNSHAPVERVYYELKVLVKK